MRYKGSSIWCKSSCPPNPIPLLFYVTLFLLSFIFHLDFTLFLSNAYWASLVAYLVKNPPANAGDVGSILGWEDHLEKDGNPLQYSYLENSMDRGNWWAIVYGVTKSWTP